MGDNHFATLPLWPPVKMERTHSTFSGSLQKLNKNEQIPGPVTPWSSEMLNRCTLSATRAWTLITEKSTHGVAGRRVCHSLPPQIHPHHRTLGTSEFDFVKKRKIFAGVSKDPKMRSSWIFWVGPGSNHQYSWKTQNKGKGRWKVEGYSHSQGVSVVTRR